MAEKSFISVTEFAKLQRTSKIVEISTDKMSDLNKPIRTQHFIKGTQWNVSTDVYFVSSEIDGKEVVYPVLEIRNQVTQRTQQVSLRSFVWFLKYDNYTPEGELMSALFECNTLGEVAELLGGKSFVVSDLMQMPRMKFVENGYVEEEGKTSFNPIFDWIK
jgi:hypothetical protein